MTLLPGCHNSETRVLLLFSFCDTTKPRWLCKIRKVSFFPLLIMVLDRRLKWTAAPKLNADENKKNHKTQNVHANVFDQTINNVPLHHDQEIETFCDLWEKKYDDFDQISRVERGTYIKPRLHFWTSGSRPTHWQCHEMSLTFMENEWIFPDT